MLTLDTAFAVVIAVSLTVAALGWQADHRALHALAEAHAELKRQFEQAMERSGNRLHWQAMEDERARGINAFILMSNAAKDIADALDTLAPHMRKPK